MNSFNPSLRSFEALDQLGSYPKFGTGIGLARMLEVLKKFPDQDWVSHLDVLKVTGSKGKGSTASFAAAILAQLGEKTGLFISPHLYQFNERITVGGQEIPDPAISEGLAWFKPLESEWKQKNDQVFGSFEAVTAVALHYFSAVHASALVMEAGIGGRFDATRTIPGSTVALTSVELEHTDILGNTTELIGYDKADLCPPGGTLIVGELEQSLLQRLQAYCQIRNVHLLDSQELSHVSDIQVTQHGMSFQLTCMDIDFGVLQTKFFGEQQIANSIVALISVWNWLSRNRPDIDTARFQKAVQSALAETIFPGRFEVVHTDPLCVIDVAHTPQSIQKLVETMRLVFPERKVVLVTGISEDKNARGILSELLPLAYQIIVTQAEHKGGDSQKLVDFCQEIQPQTPAIRVPVLSDAIRVAFKQAKDDDAIVLIAGGLFLATEAAIVIRKELDNS